ncbi:MAG: immune inhibitor A, partial [Dehalococcoidia bacterium]|nr:immune inhibitor A [Dehalococcoidia bacterium]
SAQQFEDHIFPTITHYYGESWYSGVDSDRRLTVINARIPSVAGYFSAADQYPTQVNPYSNQRKAIYMNLGAVRPGSPGYNAVLAHEFQHALYWGIKPYSEAWINEGAAELAAEISGFPSGFPNSFLNQPDTQLDTWPEEPGSSPAHYGAAMLFLKYLAQHFGGYEALGDVLSAPGRAPTSITNFLTAKGYGTSFDAVFKDWVVANYLVQAGGGRYGYTLGPSPAKSQTINQVGTQEGTVHQYAADYLELGFSSGDLEVEFQGDPRVQLIPNQPHSGQAEWWSNRGDSMDSTLTREFDLQGVQKASLRFWTWYDLEKPWDYVYVEVSVDNGKTWSILPGKSSTLDNPLGN